jgi:hypothetical protein
MAASCDSWGAYLAKGVSLISKNADKKVAEVERTNNCDSDDDEEPLTERQKIVVSKLRSALQRLGLSSFSSQILLQFISVSILKSFISFCNMNFSVIERTSEIYKSQFTSIRPSRCLPSFFSTRKKREAIAL